MGRISVIFVLAVCFLWSFGATLSCDECGRACMPTCGTRQFRACCYNNNQKKRVPDLGLRLRLAPPRETDQIQLVYDA